eukprot:COSAG02_NODE_48181_length_335_cov_1.288136_1_plen_70_part_01
MYPGSVQAHRVTAGLIDAYSCIHHAGTHDTVHARRPAARRGGAGGAGGRPCPLAASYMEEEEGVPSVAFG